MKVTCPQCKRRVFIRRGKNTKCTCRHVLNYRYFLHEKIAYDVFLVDANVLIYAFAKAGLRKQYCHSVITMKSPTVLIATTKQILDEVGSVVQQQLPETIHIYTIGHIRKELQELKTNVFKQPSRSDLSLVQAAFNHPEVRGIITYDKDFSRIATAGLIERRSSAKFWLGDAKQFVEKQRIPLKENEYDL